MFFFLQSGVIGVNQEPVESSNFGAVHFLVIFVIIGAFVVTGYLCLHNKKKVSAIIYSLGHSKSIISFLVTLYSYL